MALPSKRPYRSQVIVSLPTTSGMYFQTAGTFPRKTSALRSAVPRGVLSALVYDPLTLTAASAFSIRTSLNSSEMPLTVFQTTVPPMLSKWKAAAGNNPGRATDASFVVSTEVPTPSLRVMSALRLINPGSHWVLSLPEAPKELKLRRESLPL